MFLSPSGEPFRPTPGGPDPFDAWFDRADANHDGKIDRAEFRADADAFFKRLDGDHDGVVDGFEINAYERDVAPELAAEAERQAFGGAQRVYRGAPEGGRPSRRRGGGRPAQDGAPGEHGPPAAAGHVVLLNEPEPISGADLDVDGKVTAAEWLATTDRRFDQLDSTHAGFLTKAGLKAPPKPGKGQR